MKQTFMTPEEFAKLKPEEQKTLLKKVADIQNEQKVIETEAKKLPQLSMDDLKGVVGEAVKTQIGKMDKTDKKYFAFPGIGTAGVDDLTPEGKFIKTRNFLKALSTGDVVTSRAMSEEVRVKANLSEGTAVSGGYLVPEEFKAEILRFAPLYGVIRRETRHIPMRYDVLNIPTAGTTDQSAIWTNEAAAIKQTDPNFGQVVLTINKLAAIPKVSNELLADADVDTISYLAELIAEQFAKAEDEAGFNGSGAPFVGALQATGVPTTPQAGGTGWSAMSYQDLVNCTSGLYSNALGNAKFYMHRSQLGHVRGLITTAGAPIIGNQNSFFGYPIVSSEIMPRTQNVTVASTQYMIFGDLRRGMAMGERGSIQMKISTEATVDSDNLFQQDMAALRMIERIAIGVVLPSSFLRYTSAAS